MIRKAVIPLAGLGTRLRPWSFGAPKAMLPLFDARGCARPVVDFIVAEAASAGVERAALVVSLGHREPIETYFASVRAAGLSRLPGEIRFFVQDQPLGFGDAVALGEEFVGNDPFLLLLGDHVHLAAPGKPPCAAQVVQAFDERGGAAMVGTQPVGRDELRKVGVARGRPLGGREYVCEDFIEKPTPAQARRRLVTPGLPRGTHLAHCGIYVFAPEIFDCLARVRREVRRTRREIQLADAQSMLLERHPHDYYLYRVAGSSYDTGTPENYAETFAAFARRKPRPTE